MGDLSEIALQTGAAAVILLIVLTKVVEIIKYIIPSKSNNVIGRHIYVAQPEMCKVQYEQLVKQQDDHKTESDKNWRDSFKLLRSIKTKTDKIK